jgi:hypothetical protein
MILAWFCPTPLAMAGVQRAIKPFSAVSREQQIRLEPGLCELDPLRQLEALRQVA